MFSAAAPTSADPIRIEQAAQHVLTQIRQERISRSLRSRRRPWLAAAAAIVVMVGAGAAWWLVPIGGVTSPADVVEHADHPALEEPPPRVQVEMPDEGVRVYQFAEGDDDDGAVYFIVNPALES
jgi:hypothetical protein